MKNMYRELVIIILITVTQSTLFAQTGQLTGLWLIENVQVGTEEMTPIARWTRIDADGTYESGNGWLKHSTGSWEFNSSKNTFLPTAKNGPIDPAGPFSVVFNGDQMEWSRKEGGETVSVSLRRIEELPASPADRIKGLWGLDRAVKGNEDITDVMDPDGNHYLFLRWDRIYIERSSEGVRLSGYWHMHGHRPELTMLPHSEGADPQGWIAETPNEMTLILNGISDSNEGVVLTYKRLSSFPE